MMSGQFCTLAMFITHSLSLGYHAMVIGNFPDHDVDDVQEDEEVAAEDEEDMGVIETYSNYKPSKLKVSSCLKP